MIGSPVTGAVLLIEALLQKHYLGTNDRVSNGAAVAFIYLYIVVYQLVDVPSFVWCSEIFPTTIRAKGIGLCMFSYFVGFVTFATPGPMQLKTMYVLSPYILMLLLLCLLVFGPDLATVPSANGERISFT